MFNSKNVVIGIILVSAVLTASFFLSGCGTTVITVKNDSLEVIRNMFLKSKEFAKQKNRI